MNDIHLQISLIKIGELLTEKKELKQVPNQFR